MLSHGEEAATLFEQNYSLGDLTKSKLECGNILLCTLSCVEVNTLKSIVNYERGS